MGGTGEHQDAEDSILLGGVRDGEGEARQRVGSGVPASAGTGAGVEGVGADVWARVRGAMANSLGLRVWTSTSRVRDQAVGRTSPPPVAGYSGGLEGSGWNIGLEVAHGQGGEGGGDAARGGHGGQESSEERGGAARGGQPARDESGAGGGERMSLPLSVWAARLAPFALLFSAVFVAQHLEGMCWLVLVSYLLSKMNDLMKGQVTERKCPRLTLVVMIVGTELIVLSVFTVWQERGLFDHLRIMRYQGPVPNFLTLVWVIMMYDVLSKHISLAVKALWLMLPNPCLTHRKTSHLINVQEALFAMHRDMLPIPLWYMYLSSTTPTVPLITWAAQLIYLSLKASRATHNLFLFATQAKGLALHGSPYGTYVAMDELLEGEQGGESGAAQCSICHDTFRDPIRTPCRHTFCEKCLEDWLERDVTCPLCRSVVARSVTISRGSTVPALPTIF